MAVTNYYSMDGMIFAESTNGVMRNYGTDALGSVVETIVNGAVENTYQYKPYGGLLAKTGTAPDPTFLWNGGSGYRASTLVNSEYYVRHRVFSSVSAQWTTADPLWPIQPLYRYGRSNPVIEIDRTGFLPCKNEGTSNRFPALCPDINPLDNQIDGCSDCDTSSGTMWILNCDKKCTVGCTSIHESIHAKDYEQCCKKFKGQAYSFEWQKYLQANLNFSECNAWSATLPCLCELARTKNCGDLCSLSPYLLRTSPPMSNGPLTDPCCDIIAYEISHTRSMKDHYCKPGPKAAQCPYQ